jgi:hypothetical protein
MSRLIDLLSNNTISAGSVNELFDLAFDSDLSVLSTEQLRGLEQVISNMLVMSQDSTSGAIIYNPLKASRLLGRVRELQCVIPLK